MKRATKEGIILAVIKQLAVALKGLEEKETVHVAIGPSNILLSFSEGKPVITLSEIHGSLSYNVNSQSQNNVLSLINVFSFMIIEGRSRRFAEIAIFLPDRWFFSDQLLSFYTYCQGVSSVDHILDHSLLSDELIDALLVASQQ